MGQDKEYPNILLISDATWADDNNIGNTFSNLFQFWSKDKLAMIYARPDLPNTVVCDNFFQISENRLIGRLFNKNIKSGIKINTSMLEKINIEKDTLRNDEEKGKKIYRFFLKYRWNIFLLARELLWKISKWKTKELDEFIEEYNPDIILSLACASIYMNNLQQYVIKHSKSKSTIYFVDDVYSLKQLSFSPLFWINKYLIRRSIKKTVEASNIIYTIVAKQKEEYDKSLKIQSKLLTKGGVFDIVPDTKIKGVYPYKFVYTGNIYAGRWESLEMVGRALDKINLIGEKGILYIYSKNILTSKMKRVLSEIKSIKYMGAIPASDVNRVQNDSDILVHVESFRIRAKLSTRLSFSTKLIDYFAKGKCILAVGDQKSASIEYLKNNNAAIVVDDLDKIQEQIKNLIDNPQIIEEYGLNAWKCGERNHQIGKIQRVLYDDLKILVEEEYNESITN